MAKLVQKDIWQNCYACEDKCCTWSLAFPLFTTPEERKRLPKINTMHPCAYYNKDGSCDIHKEKPIDCRLFPFEILKLEGEFYWIIWDVNCSILAEGNYEPYLQQHERDIIPKFVQYLDDYASFRLDEFLDKYHYKLLREVRTH